MIPKIFEKNISKDVQTMIAFLPDCISCTVTEERNGIFECFMTYPVNGESFKEIQRERVLLVKPNHTMDDQFFRIYRITKPLNGIVSVYAQHISYDLANLPVMPFSYKSAAITTILRDLFKNSGFTYTTNYSTSKKFSVDVPKSIRACLGGEEGSVLSLWHGEFTFDNFNVKFNTSRGTNRGVSIEYGKNLTDIEADSDNSGVYTECLPYAVFEDTVITLKEKTIPITKNEFSRKKTLILDLTDQFDSDETIDETKLRTATNSYISENVVGTAVPSIKVSFEPFTTDGNMLDRVDLCDTVAVRYPLYDIEGSAKVTQTVYDAILERYESITLGEMRNSMADTITQKLSSVKKKSEKVYDRFASKMDSAIESATQTITGAKGGNVVITKNADGKPTEILIMDTADTSTAKKVWRWNSGGLGYSSNGYYGPYTTAITSAGEIVADFITTGQLTANLLTAGKIQSLDESSYWDIETGDIKIKGNITADSLTLGSGVTLPYGKISGVPDFITTAKVNTKLGDYLKSADLNSGIAQYVSSNNIINSTGLNDALKSYTTTTAMNNALKDYLTKTDSSLIFVGADGKVTSKVPVSKCGTIAEGTTGIIISNTGLLQAANAVIYGTIYASAGDIAGWCIAGKENPPNGFWNYSLSSVITNTSARKQYAVFLRGGKTLNSTNVVIGVKQMGTNYESNSTNWSNSKKSDGTYPSDAEYNFAVRADGRLTAHDAVISSGDGTAKVTVSDGGLTFYTTVSNTLKQYGLIKAVIDGNIDMNKPVLSIQANSSNAAGMMLSSGSNAWYAMFKDGTQQTDDMDSVKHKFYGQTMVTGKFYTSSSIISGNNIVLENPAKYLYGRNSSGTSRRVAGVSSNDNVLIGNTDTKTVLYGTGVYLNGTTTAVTSDERLKYDIEPLDDKREEFFKKLKPVNFKYIDGTSKRTHTGFIAQEVKVAGEESGIDTQDLAAYTEFESEREDFDTESALRYDEFIALNTHMIQKLMARVDVLEEENKKLKEKIYGN